MPRPKQTNVPPFQVCDHLHGGESGFAFVTSHVALNNMLEQAMQAVNPKVSLAYWDYSKETIDCAFEEASTTCYWDIWQSDVFTVKKKTS